MLRFLFPSLTAQEARGAALFSGLVREMRQPGWYREGGVPDSLEGRFAVLASLTALVTVRLEALGADGERMSVALAERFVEAMDAEHREMGLGDPTLGKTVRKLMALLARRVALWRDVEAGKMDWDAAADDSLTAAGQAPAPAARHQLRDIRDALAARSPEDLQAGRLR